MNSGKDTQRWITLVFCLIASLCAGFGYSWSVLLKPLGETFGWSASAVSLSFTLLIVFAASTSIFAGKALQYIQPRTLLLVGAVVFGAGIACLGFVDSLGMLYGLSMVSGVGLGIIYPGATMTNLIRFFPDKRGLASGLLAAGYGIGPVVWAPITVALIDNLGLMWAFRIMGMLFFVLVAVCSRLVTTAPIGYAPVGYTPEVARMSKTRVVEDKDWKDMLKSPVFYVLFILFTIGTTSGLMVIGHASPIAQDVLGISPEAAGAVVSYLAIGMVVGKIGWGALSDRVGRYPVFIAMLIMAAIALVVLWRSGTYLPVVLGICAVGVCYGGFLALMSPITAETFGNKNLGINFGIMFLTVALAAYVGPRLAASVLEATGGDYAWAFIIAAIISVAGLALVIAYLLARLRLPAKSAVEASSHRVDSADKVGTSEA
ncbi:MAG: OFA family MFS transporter [Actinobacteria bacterium]|nr:OFA family MFS transporter [Actinomycetota bacterium]